MKRPSFQWYPSDWLRDTALRTCSVGARGLWIDMLCFMHEGNPYGTLKVGNKVILPVNLASMIGATLEETQGWLDELENAGVFDRGDEGEIMSRRMIRDESLRNIRAAGGKLGGNPALTGGKVNLKDNHKVAKEDKQKPTPSSSTSSSSSILINAMDGEVLDLIWKMATAKGRERSSKANLRKAWQKIPQDKKPNKEEIEKALRAWNASQKWKDGFSEGIHLWVQNEQWDNLPLPDKSQKDQVRSTFEFTPIRKFPD